MKEQTGMIEVVAYIEDFKTIQLAKFESLKDAKDFIAEMKAKKTELLIAYRMEEEEA